MPHRQRLTRVEAAGFLDVAENAMTKRMTFMAACKDFFGLRDGQTALDFGKEIKALTDADKAEIREGLEKMGYEIIQAAA